MWGRLSSLVCKNVEPIALEMGTPVRMLQEILVIHCWNDQTAAKRLQELVQNKHGCTNAIGVIDETSLIKKGEKRPMSNVNTAERRGRSTTV